MSDDLALPPPRDGSGPARDAAPTHLAHPVSLAVTAVALGLVTAMVIGVLTGSLLFSVGSADCTPSDGWCELGAAVGALFGGVLAGVIAYVAAGVAVVSRSRPRGGRARHVAIHLAVPPAVLASLALLGGLAW